MDQVARSLGRNDEDGCQQAVDWLTVLRQLQRDGMDFDSALAEANRRVAS